jgi:hypothetical protein
LAVAHPFDGNAYAAAKSDFIESVLKSSFEDEQWEERHTRTRPA